MMAGKQKQMADFEYRTPWQIAMQRLRRHRMAIFALRLLVVLYLLTIFAGFISPYHYDNENRDHSYHNALRFHFFDDRGEFHWRPFVYASSYEFNDYYNRVWEEDTSQRYPLKFFVKGDRYTILGLFEAETHLFGVDPPGRIYLFGADHRGRDLFSRILFGGQISLTIGLVGVSISFTIGMIIGGISGYLGGNTDFAIQRFCEMIMLIPTFYLLLVLRNTFPPDLSSVQVYFGIIFVLSFIYWASFSRVIRGMVLSIREQEFVLAARAAGLPTLRIIVRHILPNTLSYAIVYVSLTIPYYILGESALSLIGLGIQDPVPSWGNLLQKAVSVPELKFHPWILIPGFFIFVAVMAFNFLGDGLRDAFDPKSLQGQDE
ncbi:MAG: ABC transporter permease [Planctomycetota bacterium]|jgi:peptide/nickel transport system permease protein